jgi:hypothetical protein
MTVKTTVLNFMSIKNPHILSPVLFLKSDKLRKISESLCFWTLCTIRCSKNYKTQHSFKGTQQGRSPPYPHLRTETDPVSKTLFSSLQNTRRWLKSRNSMILSVISIITTLYILPRKICQTRKFSLAERPY